MIGNCNAISYHIKKLAVHREITFIVYRYSLYINLTIHPSTLSKVNYYLKCATPSVTSWA